NLAFRVSGKIVGRDAEEGQHVAVGQVLARLEPKEQEANVANAQAALASAEAQHRQAQMNFQRQQQLMGGGFTTRPAYDQAEQSLRTTQASVEAAEAALGQSREQLAYTDLKSTVNGIIVTRSAEVGQV